MKPKTMILMVVAVACGLGASYMTSRLLADRNKQTAEVPTVPVLVAKVRVPSWQPIKDPEKLFEIKQYPQDVAPKKALSRLEDIKDQRLRTFLDEGKPLTQDDLVSKEQADLAAQILPGQRATAIKVNAESLAGGFILPGTRVDVVCTMRGGEQASKVILQNMLVLAVDQGDQRPEAQKTILGQTVTLAASPEEAGRLSLGQSLGELRLWLRGHGDTERIKALVIRPEDLNKVPEWKGDKKGEKSQPVGVGTTDPIPELPGEAPKDKVQPRAVKVEEPAEEPTKVVRKAEKHLMKIREGAAQRTEVVATREAKDPEEGDDEEGPAAVKQEDRPVTKPKNETPRTNPAPGGGGTSTKTGRTRTGK